MRTVYLNAAYFPAVELLSAIGTGGDPPLRRLSGRSTAISQIGVAGRVRRLPERSSSTRSSRSRSSTRPTSRGWRRWTRSSSCWTRSRTWSTSPTRWTRVGFAARSSSRRVVLLRVRRRRRRWRRADWALETWACRAGRADGCARWRDRRRQVDAGEAGRAVLRPAAGAGAGRRARSAGSAARARCAASSGSSRRRGSCSRARCERTSRSGGPDASEEEIARCRARPSARDGSSSGYRMGYETEVGERGVPAFGGAAAAGRVRAGAAGRAADPDPRRGDVERRRAHRADDRAGARAAAARAHRDRHRPPAFDDPAGRADRRARARPDRGGGNARRADRRGRRYARLYGAWAESAAA